MNHGESSGQFIRRVLAVSNESDAKTLFDGEVSVIQGEIDAGRWAHPQDAITAARMNIGWCFGEGMSQERCAMWNRVCGASHPIFGSQKPTPEQAVAAGFAEAKRSGLLTTALARRNRAFQTAVNRTRSSASAGA
jgi:hypothetical protein